MQYETAGKTLCLVCWERIQVFPARLVALHFQSRSIMTHYKKTGVAVCMYGVINRQVFTSSERTINTVDKGVERGLVRLIRNSQRNIDSPKRKWWSVSFVLIEGYRSLGRKEEERKDGWSWVSGVIHQALFSQGRETWDLLQPVHSGQRTSTASATLIFHQSLNCVISNSIFFSFPSNV